MTCLPLKKLFVRLCFFFCTKQWAEEISRRVLPPIQVEYAPPRFRGMDWSDSGAVAQYREWEAEIWRGGKFPHNQYEDQYGRRYGGGRRLIWPAIPPGWGSMADAQVDMNTGWKYIPARSVKICSIE